MPAKNKEIDAYIRDSAPFAKPILTHLRALVHTACPDAEEKMKWRFPHFDYKGQMMCSMAAFKQHCVFNFWKAPLMKDKVLMENARSETAMGHLGRIQDLTDLPPDKKILAWIKEAMALNDAGKTVQRPKPSEAMHTELRDPEDLHHALTKNKKAKAAWEKASYACRKEYIQWITEAKTEPTREKRIATTVAWIAEGKGRNWKYQK